MRNILLLAIFAVAGCQGSEAWLQSNNLPLRVPPPATGSFEAKSSYSQQVGASRAPGNGAAVSTASAATTQAATIQTPAPPVIADLKAQDGGWRAPVVR